MRTRNSDDGISIITGDKNRYFFLFFKILFTSINYFCLYVQNPFEHWRRNAFLFSPNGRVRSSQSAQKRWRLSDILNTLPARICEKLQKNTRRVNVLVEKSMKRIGRNILYHQQHCDSFCLLSPSP